MKYAPVTPPKVTLKLWTDFFKISSVRLYGFPLIDGADCVFGLKKRGGKRGGKIKPLFVCHFKLLEGIIVYKGQE